MLRKPFFWIAFILFTTGCAWFSLSHFQEAFSILNIDIGMTREMALTRANELMITHNFGPPGFRAAASFSGDDEFQSYVELEAGGPEAFKRLLESKQYRPFTWTVRHFKESDANETTVRFTPEGQPYEFREKLPESLPGAALDSDSARQIAERSAADWGIDMGPYTPVESSQTDQISGRRDHTFEYERPDLKTGETPCRLKLVVGGDRLIEIDHYMKVPESFTRRYREMRSANNTIAMFGSLGAVIIYVLGGCIGGLLLLLKRRAVLWRQPLIWGMSVSFIAALGRANYLPLEWMGYDTASSETTFLLMQLLQFFVSFLADGLLLVVSFMAAESLTRMAFGNHIQLWRIWSPEAGSSKTVLGMTLTGYFLVVFFLAYEVVLQYIGRNIPGWWSPSSSLSDPNILASMFPWFTPVAISLHAGFWEECLFRAVPLAGAVLLGRRFGHGKLWIIAAFILQMLIFGSGHANYAAQPAYARVIELLIPSLSFGLLYFYLGLLPAIVMHFAFDVLMIGLPLFAADGLWWDKILIVIVTLVPLFILVYRRIRQQTFTEVPQHLYNAAWQPPPLQERGDVQHAFGQDIRGIPASSVRILAFLAVLALFLWFFLTDFSSRVPPISIDRQDARDIALKTLEGKPAFDASRYTVLTRSEGAVDYQHRFVWREAGGEIYDDLIGTWLTEPHWLIRFARFEGEIADRAEEFSVALAGDGTVKEITHRLPQEKAGEDLSRDDARAIVRAHVQRHYGLEVDQLREISAVSSKQPQRRDWTFTWVDEGALQVQQGQARLEVTVGGDEIIDSRRFVHVPEDWERQERNRERNLQLLRAPFLVLDALLIVTFAILGAIAWSRKSFSTRTFLTFLFVLVPITTLKFLNDWPTVFSRFSTAEPLKNQVIQSGAGLIFSLILCLLLAMLMGFCQGFKRSQIPTSSTMTIVVAVSVGTLATGIFSLLRAITPLLEPQWPDLSAINTHIPAVHPTLRGLWSSFLMSAQILLIVIGIDVFSNGWTRRKVPAFLLLVLSGFMLGAVASSSVKGLLISGLVIGAVLCVSYLLVWRFNLSSIPLAVATIVAFGAIEHIVHATYPGALVGFGLAAMTILLAGFTWTTKILEAPADGLNENMRGQNLSNAASL